MTARLMDSCACYASAADVGTAGYGVSGSTGYQTSGGRWGTGAIRVTNSAATAFSRAFTGLATWIVGFDLRFASVGPSQFFYMREAATEHLSLRIDGSNRITLTRSGTVLGTSSTILNTGTDYLIAVKFTVHDTTGSAEVWINGTKEIDVSGVDTRNGGTGVVDTFLWGGASSGSYTADISGIYIYDTAGSVNNALVADWRIYPRRVTANGTTNNFAPSASTNASNVDDTQGNDGDTTYNSSSTPGDIDLFQFGAVPWTSGTIAAIQHRIVARKDDAGARTIRPKQRQSSTNYNGTTRTLTTAYAHYTEIIETNPSTSAAYTTTEMRSTSPEFGYEEVA